VMVKWELITRLGKRARLTAGELGLQAETLKIDMSQALKQKLHWLAH